MTEAAPPKRQGLRRRLATAWERLFRYDFFISYAWVDGRDYAVALVDQLKARPYRPRCFIDHAELGGGLLDPTIRTALRRSRAMILVGTSGAMKSLEVQTEVTTFASTGNQRIVTIDVDGAVRELGKSHPLHTALNRRVRVPVSVGADGQLSPEISEPVLAEIDKIAGFLTSGRLQQIVLAAIVVVALALSATAAVFYGSASATATLNRASTLAGAAENELSRGARTNYLPLVRAAADVAMTRETRDALLMAVLAWPRLEALQQLTFNWPMYMALSDETEQFVGVDPTKVHALAYPSLKRLHRPVMLDQVTIRTVASGREGGTLYLGYDTGAIAAFDLRSGTATDLYQGEGEISAIAAIADGWLFFIRKINQRTETCLLQLSNAQATNCHSIDGFNPHRSVLVDGGRKLAVLGDDSRIFAWQFADRGGTPNVEEPTEILGAQAGGGFVSEFAADEGGDTYALAIGSSLTLYAGAAASRVESFDKPIAAVAISASGKLVAVALEGGGLVVIDTTANGARTAFQTISPAAEGMLKFTADETTLDYLDKDGLLTRWSLNRDSSIATTRTSPRPILGAGPSSAGGFVVLTDGSGACSTEDGVNFAPIGLGRDEIAIGPVLAPSGSRYAFLGSDKQLYVGKTCDQGGPIAVPGLDDNGVDLLSLADDQLWILDSANRLAVLDPASGREIHPFAELPGSTAVLVSGEPVTGVDDILSLVYSPQRHRALAIREDGSSWLIRPYAPDMVFTRPEALLHLVGLGDPAWFDAEEVDLSLAGFSRDAALYVSPSGRTGAIAMNGVMSVLALDGYDTARGAAMRADIAIGSQARSIVLGSDSEPIFALHGGDGDGEHALRLTAIDSESLLPMAADIPLLLDDEGLPYGMTLDGAGEHLLAYNGTTKFRVMDATLGLWKQALDRIAVLPLPERESLLYGFGYSLLPDWPARPATGQPH
jgi:hypothetical protein